MPWLRIDDKMSRHHKIAGLSDAAFRLHIHAMLYCAEQLTNGRIGTAVSPMLSTHGDKAALIKELVEAGLWETIVGGWEIHDYLDWNPSKEEVQKKKEARAAAGRTGGMRSSRIRAIDTPNAEAIALANGQAIASDEAFDQAIAPANAKHVASPAGQPPYPSRTHPIPSQTDPPPTPPSGESLLAFASRGYAGGIHAITKKTWGFPDRPDEWRAIGDIVALHAPGLKGDSLEAKLTAISSSYCEATIGNAKFEGGFRPGKCLEWLNAGRPGEKTIRGRSPTDIAAARTNKAQEEVLRKAREQ